MYVGYNVVYTIKGKISNNILEDIENNIKLPTKQKIKESKTGYIQFLREANGVCNVLRVVECEL